MAEDITWSQKKENCWEALACAELDCPVRDKTRLNGVYGGVNGGRACWVVAGTKCKQKKNISGKRAKDLVDCTICFWIEGS